MFVSMHLLLLVLGISAQSPAPPPVTAGWQEGFVVQSANGDNRIVLGATVQVDGRFSLDEPQPITNTFTIRKARPTLTGRVAKYFEFKLMPDFGNGTTTLFDAYVDMRFSPRFRIRAGKDKTPVGYELLQGDPYLLFAERPLASSLVPNRDVGFQAIGEIAPRVTYSAGIFNGVPDGSSSSTDVDANHSKDVAGRITWQPFRAGGGNHGAASGLGFHIGGSMGSQTGGLPVFRTSVGQPYFSYATGAAASGDRRRVTPAVFYYYGSFGAFAEYMRSAQEIARSSTSERVTNEAWEVTASYVLTGEPASDRGVRPARAFDPQLGQWGALQLVARYSELHIDPIAFSRGLAASTASANAASWAAGANWYPAAPIKYYVMYEHTAFRGGGLRRPTEHVVVVRLQLAF
jgi:phosphate-selective porin OprO/OprP